MIGGLQEPSKEHICSFDIERGEFVQILHDEHGHWLLVSMVGAKNDGEVYVYDSMFPSVGTYTRKQIASILCTKQSKIELYIMDIQMQAGGSDCGQPLLFAHTNFSNLENKTFSAYQ